MAEPKAIVRIASTDVDGSLPVFKALRRIKGVGFMFSNAVCQVNNIDLNGTAVWKVGEIVSSTSTSSCAGNFGGKPNSLIL